MIGPTGPQLIEYNVRFGDPETEVLAPLYAGRLLDLVASAAHGDLVAVPRVEGAAVTVVLAAAGYPGAPRHGDVIAGLGANGQLALAVEGVSVYHAGTTRGPDGQFLTHGGRVLALSAVAPSLAEARERAYAAAATVSFEGMVWRSDIAREVAP
jgi:phosphoribosylamine--glycine ligase